MALNVVRRDAAVCLKLRDKPTLRGHRRSGVVAPKLTILHWPIFRHWLDLKNDMAAFDRDQSRLGIMILRVIRLGNYGGNPKAGGLGRTGNPIGKSLPAAALAAFNPQRADQTTVQGFAADEVEPDTFQQITCIICQQTHFVNPATGKALGADDE